MRSTRAFGAVGVAFVLLAGGCSTGQEPTDVFTGPNGPQLKSVYTAATDPAVKETLKDGKITRAEYDAAVQRYVACAKDRGVTITPTEQYGLYTYEVTGQNADAVLDACRPVIETIESLYSQVLTNPQDLDFNTLIVGCLQRAGLAPRDYTGKQLVADMKANTFPFNMDDPAFGRCWTNPQTDG